MSTFPAHPAWDFVTRLYERPGVAAACLALQERHGIDVTLMLFCLWRGSAEGVIPDGQMGALAAAAREWREATVTQIRVARRWLRQQPEHERLYRTVLAAEIDCEHGELLMLAQLADISGGRRKPATEAMADNLTAFFSELGVEPDEEDRQSIDVILAAATPSPRPIT
ncbi:hypothetical protein N182_27800 [Sinorhizobium sp. GL2]|nr:hypothetical protein N182_27800 [Sinorhizobium sp. GL2]